MVAEFADSRGRPSAPWLIEQAASGGKATASPTCTAAARSPPPAIRTTGRQASCSPAPRMPCPAAAVVGLFPCRHRPRHPCSVAALLAVAEALVNCRCRDLYSLGGPIGTSARDDAFAAFVQEFAECHPAFLELTRLAVTLTGAALLRRRLGRSMPPGSFSEQVACGFPAYHPGPASAAALAALTGSRSSNIILELAQTLCSKAADRSAESRASTGTRRWLALRNSPSRRVVGVRTGAAPPATRWRSPPRHGRVWRRQWRTNCSDHRLQARPTRRRHIAARGPDRGGLAAQVGNVEFALELAARIEEPWSGAWRPRSR